MWAGGIISGRHAGAVAGAGSGPQAAQPHPRPHTAGQPSGPASALHKPRRGGEVSGGAQELAGTFST